MKTLSGIIVTVFLLASCGGPADDSAGYEHHDSPIDSVQLDKDSVGTSESPESPAQGGAPGNSQDHGTNTGYDNP